MKKNKYLSYVTALILMLFLSQCYYDEIIPELTEPVSGKDISFQGDIIPLFNASCNTSGCHNTGGTPPDLTADRGFNALIGGNYINTTVPENSELYQWMIGRRNLPMPISGPNASYNATVLQWIKQGALNN